MSDPRTRLEAAARRVACWGEIRPFLGQLWLSYRFNIDAPAPCLRRVRTRFGPRWQVGVVMAEMLLGADVGELRTRCRARMPPTAPDHAVAQALVARQIWRALPPATRPRVDA